MPFLPFKFCNKAKWTEKKIHTHTVTTLLLGPTRERVEHWATHWAEPRWPFLFFFQTPPAPFTFFFSLSNQSSLLSPRHCSPSCNTPMGEGEKCRFFFLVEFHGVFLLVSQEVSVTLVVKVVHRVLVASRVASSP